jgi:hypothetical protein
MGMMNTQIRARAELQYLQGIKDHELGTFPREREKNYGEAYAAMLSINDEKIREVAPQVMLGEFRPHENKNEKLDAINAAILRLGEIIAENIGQ